MAPLKSHQPPLPHKKWTVPKNENKWVQYRDRTNGMRMELTSRNACFISESNERRIVKKIQDGKSMAEVVGCVYELLSLLLQDARGRGLFGLWIELSSNLMLSPLTHLTLNIALVFYVVMFREFNSSRNFFRRKICLNYKLPDV